MDVVYIISEIIWIVFVCLSIAGLRNKQDDIEIKQQLISIKLYSCDFTHIILYEKIEIKRRLSIMQIVRAMQKKWITEDYKICI